MSFRCVRTVSGFRSLSCALPGFLLLRGNVAPKTAIFASPSSNIRFFSSDTAPMDFEENKSKSVLKNFPVFSIFQDWKNKFLPVKEVSSDDAAENMTTSAIDLALNSVVKVFIVSSKHRIFQPWQISMQSECTGSGFVISGKRILTNAHVVADQTSVKVRKHGSPKKYKAKVQVVGHECDLAILEIDNEEFWEGLTHLELGDIPSQMDSVAVVGYPEGGDSISVTQGVVSRVVLRRYSHSSTELLKIQIDAAINSGNSGGPVIMGNKVVGVAFESRCCSELIGYIIPTPVIRHFLNGVEESGQHFSFCSMNLSYLTMEHAHTRNALKMGKEMTGIAVKSINPLSDAHKVLKKDDVIILAIDGVSIGNYSTVPFRKQDRVSFKHLVSMKKPCDTASFKVLREGKEHEFNISLKPVQPLVPVNQYDMPPSYYIYGGLVFVPLTQPYIDRSYICECCVKKMPTKAGEQIVIISQILEDDITSGLSIFEDLQVKKLNGVEVDNLKHLCQLIEECSNEYLRFDLEDNNFFFLEHKSAKKATCKILKSLKIPSAMSEDLQPKQRNNRRKVPRQSKKH
ncbi:LOW QUALITY PROTEIN: putative protease Do-like 3, mitochondrial [Arabidopsis lyrata subsp. lyrata]|uniref:LOW QUALITY PROTEIN: putative protease Do-like 3, mitochondrial n=1 Tax=Arabidopsis lyrata subsp. lyrata TaxID=81972 RepID=UPI000A29BE1A|nr:LOW QUALITY PROTEIN: putative protease Do-like 3, mitochondrial [Arabidopsis lyrata subsp. lyrata]|eukprot:XP_020865619.1 LOW QUALITY PROTEIN: putative protease Do-like 3, mitochondrial [Arabidopsis lyrata subsp. lyrata]